MTVGSLALWLALSGCGGDDDGPRSPDPTPTAATGDTGVAPGPCDELSWANTGQPFLSTWCTSCHSSELGEGERFGAPVGIDLDTYDDVVALAGLVASSAVGPEARMPPVGGADDDEVARFGQWLDCGLPGPPDDPPTACEGARTVAWVPDVCASGEAVIVEGDVLANGGDGSCVCAITGSLTATGGDGDWARLTSVGGAVRVDGAELHAPALTNAASVEVVAVPGAGEVDLSRLLATGSVDVTAAGLASLDLHDLRTVDGDVSIVGNPALAYLDLSRLETVGGSVVLEDNDALPTVIGELYGLRTVGGDLRLAGHATWQGFYGCGLLETVGGELQIVENARFGVINGFTALASTGGAIRVVSNPLLQILEGFDQLSSVGGDLVIAGNPQLTTEDAFSQLAYVEGQVVVSGNPSLEDVGGLLGIEDVGGLVFNDVLGLSTLGGYAELSRVRGDLSFRGTGLHDLAGFPVLDTLEGSFVVEANPRLQSVVGFAVLDAVGGGVSVRTNPQLSSLEGLQKVDAIAGNLTVQDNPQLSEAGLQPWLDTVVVGGAVELSGNAP